jgi:hypothetical protein
LDPASGLRLLTPKSTSDRARPAIGFDQRDEAFDHVVEQRRLFLRTTIRILIWIMTGFSGRRMVLAGKREVQHDNNLASAS